MIAVVGGKSTGKTAACLKLAHWIQNRPCSKRCSTCCATRAHAASFATNHSFTVGLAAADWCGPEVMQQAHQLAVPVLTQHSCLPSASGATWSSSSATSAAHFVSAAQAEARKLKLSVLIFDCPSVSETSGKHADSGKSSVASCKTRAGGKALLGALLPQTDLLLFAVDAQQGLLPSLIPNFVDNWTWI